MSPFAQFVALPVRAYRLVFSPWVGHNCRYHPTCSAYALDALEQHGALRGGWLAVSDAYCVATLGEAAAMIRFHRNPENSQITDMQFTGPTLSLDGDIPKDTR